ncbi:hypothetical protein LTR16_001417 [Cryomyces antarcticus]|uniref:3-oxoacyl-[acyl-carrier-protein] reductase n=1 Tax=Cryomyces antarcticus TaxID=329879 RepID=A0ABR0KTZ6_9PEZI|nr:hypothetical protein LTR16_001417 [Cryomyces antarcticus]
MAARLAPHSLRLVSSGLPSFRPAATQAPAWARTFASTPSSQADTRTAIVTGSSRGIGKAIALRLANDGYDICVNDVFANSAGVDEVVSSIKSLGRNAVPAIADVSDLGQVEQMIQKSVAELGPLNTMVANAGIAQVKALLDLTQQDLRKMFEVNVYGVFNCYSAAAKQMIEQKTPGKLATHKITVNAYAPGIVGTAMWDLIDEELGKMKGVPKGDTIKKYTEDLIALGRTSVPEDVSSMVSFLAGKDSDYVTGQTLVVDGGIVFT